MVGSAAEAWRASPGLLQETKRVARLLDIASRINTRPRHWTRRALAEAFEISERRIQEDPELLTNRLNLPLSHSRNGYYFTREMALPSITFAFGEAAALLLAAHVGRGMVGIATAELAAAFGRLKEAFPPDLRGLVAALSSEEAFLPTEADEHRRLTLECLQRALASRTTVTMRYVTASRGDAETEREIEPYAIVPHVRSFHLVGYCHLRGEVRIFKVDRMSDVALAGHHYSIPTDFDLRQYLGDSWGLLRGTVVATEEVVVRFSARAARWVSEEHWHASQRLEWQPDGSMLFTIHVGVTPDLVRWLLYYGKDALIERPAWLAEEVQREARAILTRYTVESREVEAEIVSTGGTE